MSNSVGRGVGLGCLLQLLTAVVSVLVLSDFYPRIAESRFGFVAYGVIPFLFLGLAACLAYLRGQRETGKGLLIVAAVGVLISGYCAILIYSPT